MKKTLSILLATMLILSLSISAAGAEADVKQAMFFDIPWLLSTDEVLQLLIDKEIIGSVDMVSALDGVGLDYILNEQAEPSSVGNFDPVMSAVWLVDQFEISDVKMAGYLVGMIKLNFAYDGANTEFISANVELKAPDGYSVKDEVLPDILSKLERLYGSNSEVGDEYSRKYTYRGANQTAVCVSYSKWSDSTLTLIYGTLDAIPILESNLSEARDQNDGIDSEDLSGL